MKVPKYARVVCLKESTENPCPGSVATPNKLIDFGLVLFQAILTPLFGSVVLGLAPHCSSILTGRIFSKQELRVAAASMFLRLPLWHKDWGFSLNNSAVPQPLRFYKSASLCAGLCACSL